MLNRNIWDGCVEREHTGGEEVALKVGESVGRKACLDFIDSLKWLGVSSNEKQ